MDSIELPEVKSSFFELSNGLTVIVAEQHSAPVASVQVWCQTGSVHEGEWLGSGLTHLLEHVLFNGTERRSSRQISDEIHGLVVTSTPTRPSIGQSSGSTVQPT